MTEDEARKKWCPMVRWTSHDCEAKYADPFENRGEACNCIASECMMWQWEKGTAIVDGGLQADVQLDIGYCGLAGKP